MGTRDRLGTALLVGLYVHTMVLIRRVVLHAIGSFLSGLAFATAAAPADIVKTRLMADSSYTGFVDCLGKSVRQGGVLSLYRGWTPVSEERACSAWSRVPSRY